MKLLLAIIINFALAEAVTTCGVSIASDRYFLTLIMGGTVSKENYWPWMAAVVVPSKATDRAMCTAEIIGKRWLVTAAHCAKLTMEGYILVGTNDVKKNDRKNRFKVEKIFHPPDGVDFILLKLKKPLGYNKEISPICLSRSIQGKPGENVLAAGFGSEFVKYSKLEDTRTESQYTNLLHEVVLPIKDLKKCKERLRDTSPAVPADQYHKYLCAGGINRGVMKGDSGGALMTSIDDRFYLLGTVSGGKAAKVGDDDLTVDELDLYTIIGSHCDWLEKTTNKEVRCEK